MIYKSKDNGATVLSVDTDSIKITQELPWDVDCEQLCQAFFTLAVGMTFLPASILHGMKDFAEEQLSILEPDAKDKEEI